MLNVSAQTKKNIEIRREKLNIERVDLFNAKLNEKLGFLINPHAYEMPLIENLGEYTFPYLIEEYRKVCQQNFHVKELEKHNWFVEIYGDRKTSVGAVTKKGELLIPDGVGNPGEFVYQNCYICIDQYPRKGRRLPWKKEAKVVKATENSFYQTWNHQVRRRRSSEQSRGNIY